MRFSFDAGDPPALARFWGEVLGYVPEPPPDGFASWEDWLVKMKVPEDRWTSVAALVDPEGLRSRVDAEVERLLGLGAVKVNEAGEFGEYHIVMRDPDGNEFCLQ